MVCAAAVLEDAYQAPLDAVLRPRRPIPSGQISRRAALAAGHAALAAGVAALVVAQPRCAGAALLLAGLGVLRASAPADASAPWLAGACRGLVYPAAALAAGGALSGGCLLGGAALSLYGGAACAAERGDAGASAALRLAAPLLAPFVLVAPAMAVDDARACLWLVGLSWVGLQCLRLLERDGRRASAALVAALPMLDALMLARRYDGPLVWLTAACVPAAVALRRLFPESFR